EARIGAVMKTDKDPNTLDPENDLEPRELPPGVDRRTFLMRNAVIGAAAVMTGTTWTSEARAEQAAKEAAAKPAARTGAKLGASPLSPNLDVVKRSKGPVMTVADE